MSLQVQAHRERRKVMNLSRCGNGHFYDTERYTSCPHCSGAGAPASNSLTMVFTEDPAPPVSSQEEKLNLSAPAPAGTVPMDFLPQDTLPTAPDPASQYTMAAPNVNSLDTPTVPLGESGMRLSVTDPAVFGDDDHTVAFFDDVFSNVMPDTVKPALGQGAPVVSSPCVGWLIAIGGVHIGQDFRLKVGKNFIGRDEKMDVVMTGDKSVSRNRHAVVVYEPKQHLYLIQPGESSALVYCNDEVVLSPVRLKMYDIITVGEVNLLFVPLCGKEFNWSELLEEMALKNH